MKLTRARVAQAVTLVIGALIYAMAIDLFLAPGKIAVGGFTGVATVLHRLFGTPIGTVVLVMNIPLAFFSFRMLGAGFVTRTMTAIALTSVFTDVFAFMPPMITDPLLCSLFGGVAMGIGCGLLFSKGFTTGGSDVIVSLLRLKFKFLSTGVLLMIVDGIVVVSAAIVFRDVMSVLYSIIAIFTSSRVIDTILGLNDRAKLAIIISDRHAEFADEIVRRVNRGVTQLDGWGWYTKSPRKVLMCVVGNSEAYILKEIVSGVDPKAFMILSNASEVLGQGFKQAEKPHAVKTPPNTFRINTKH